MEQTNDWQTEITNLTKVLPPEKLREVFNFMEFLYQKEKGFDYTTIENSAEYVRKLRVKQSFTQDGQQRDGREFLKELIEWQKLKF